MNVITCRQGHTLTNLSNQELIDCTTCQGRFTLCAGRQFVRILHSGASTLSPVLVLVSGMSSAETTFSIYTPDDDLRQMTIWP